MSRFARRKDGNHNEVKGYFEQMGFSVADTHMVGNDFPDLAIGKFHLTALVEIKDKGGELTPGQIKFHREWKGAIFQAKSLDDVTEIAAYFKKWISQK